MNKKVTLLQILVAGMLIFTYDHGVYPASQSITHPYRHRRYSQ